jgi:hypothetical protein
MNVGHEMYDIGAAVCCEDGPCGELSRVVVDPIKQAVTHLVVDRADQHATHVRVDHGPGLHRRQIRPPW